MTTNQTIDGVLRELKPCPFCGGSADLKCTEGDYPDWFVQCTECHASADVFGPGVVHHWNDRKLPAAQPQGEPVAWIVTDMNGDSYFAYDKQTPNDKPLYAGLQGEPGEVEKWKLAYRLAMEDNAKLTMRVAEQPAPVAVVLPQRKHVPDFTLHPMLNKEYTGWNAYDAEFRRLNPWLANDK